MPIIICKQCGAEKEVKIYMVGRALFCSRKCHADSMRGKKRKDDVTGNNGYRKTKTDGRPTLQHRYVMEKFTGRPLRKNEYVHHINGDKSDNRVSNLQIMTPKEHSFHHNQKYPLVKNCVICGEQFVPHPTKRKRAQTCSSECKGKLLSRRNQERKSPNAPDGSANES
jgi:hypothetical protein